VTPPPVGRILRLAALVAFTLRPLGCFVGRAREVVFGCHGEAVPFPDRAPIIRGLWVGDAIANVHDDLWLRFDLEVANLDGRRYQVVGEVNTACDHRLDPTGEVGSATPAPQPPQFEARLSEPGGTRAGTLLSYVDRGMSDRLEGTLEVGAPAPPRRYFVLRRAPVAGRVRPSEWSRRHRWACLLGWPLGRVGYVTAARWCDRLHSDRAPCTYRHDDRRGRRAPDEPERQ
jgi:hypothetical protein